jgi:ATP-dependent DNA helicase RecG
MRPTLQTLIAAGESLTLELKKSTAEKDRACRSLCALANGQGGQVVFGVTPAGKVVGQKVTDRTLEELAQEFQGFEPPMSPRLQRIPVTDGEEAGLEVLLIQVEQAVQAPVSFRGVPYERVLNTTRVMPRATYQRLLMESMHTTDRWEMQAAEGCGIDALDLRELLVTIEESIRRGRMEDPGTRDPMGLLRGLGLLVHGDQISRAAIALFCKDDHAIPEFPQFNLRVARFKGTTRDEFLDNRQYAGGAFALMRRAERFLIDWMPVAGKIVPGQMARIDTPALPVEAVREALANAFIHRDYASAAGSVSVALYDDRLEVISPGELHFGLTPEKLYLPHESKPWNPWIAKVFYRRGLIETWGRGTLKIAGLMQEAGLAAPTLKVSDDFVNMTFDLPSSLVSAKNGGASEQTPGKTLGKTLGKTPSLILRQLAAAPSTSIPELALFLGKSDSAIERAIRKLRAEGKLRRTGPAKGGHWEIIA